MLIIVLKTVFFLAFLTMAMIVLMTLKSHRLNVSYIKDKLRKIISEVRCTSMKTVTMNPFETIDEILSDEVPQPGHTIWLPILFVDQLEPHCHKLIKRYKVCDIPENGITISRPGATSGDIILSNATKVAYTVSENHVRVVENANGLIVQDQGSHNKMFVDGQKRSIDEVSITDGLIVYLGLQPIRFVIPEFNRVCFKEDNTGKKPNSLTEIYGECTSTTYRTKTTHRKVF